MGQMRFFTPQRDRLSDAALEHAYIAGFDLVPSRFARSWESPQTLKIERVIDESGTLHIPWPVPGRGRPLLTTASLMERERPYSLPVELARGTLHRLRSKADVWAQAGLELPDALQAQCRAGLALFTRAATGQEEPLAAAEAAEEAIRLSLDAMQTLGEEYARQALALRHKETSPLTTLLAGNLGQAPMPANAEPMFSAAFNAALAPLAWRQIQPTGPDQWQWNACDKQLQVCHRHDLRIFGGPLCRLDAESLPDWVLAYDGPFDTLVRYFRQYVLATVQRYRGQIDLWYCAGAMNRAGAVPADDEERLRLTIAAVETVHRADPRIPIIIGVDQPWGEYVASEPGALPPWQFAEMLVRADLGVAGIALELNLGYWPAGTLPRDLLDYSDLIDLWSMFGLPLIPLLTIPSGDGDDPAARADSGRPVAPPGADHWSPAVQREVVERLLPMFLAKQPVSAVIWNQVFDSVPHRFAHGGVFDARNLPRPALSALIGLRSKHLA